MANAGAYYLIPAQQYDALERRVTQLETQLSGMSFQWGSAEDYRDAGTLLEKQMFVAVDSIENLSALAQEHADGEPGNAFVIFVGNEVTP